MKKPKVEVVKSAEDAGECEFIVCARVRDGEPLLLPDNVMDFCVKCDAKVQLQPHAPTGLKPLCFECFAKDAEREGDVTIQMTQKTVDEVRGWLAAQRRKKG